VSEMNNGERLAFSVIAGGLAALAMILLLLVGAVLITGGHPNPRLVPIVIIVGAVSGGGYWRYAAQINRWMEKKQ
jgi:CHASE2 domain-containing sensor protein